MRTRRFLYPIKKVASTTATHDILECGHQLRIATDAMGERFPTKRHCRHCWKLMSEEDRKKRIEKYEKNKVS